MNADDPRHATWAGYQFGCRADCCTTAARNYQKGRVVDAHRGQPRTIDSLGTRRRVEALACLGWAGSDIAALCGHSHEWLRQVTMRNRIHRRTADQIAAIYNDLSMQLPNTDTALRAGMVLRTKRRATRLGYAPPLAWDDIDHDPAPAHAPDGRYRQPADPVVVHRWLTGDRHIPTNRAEKAEIIRRWRADGRTLNDLARITGWEPHRYLTDHDDGEAA